MGWWSDPMWKSRAQLTQFRQVRACLDMLPHAALITVRPGWHRSGSDSCGKWIEHNWAQLSANWALDKWGPLSPLSKALLISARHQRIESIESIESMKSIFIPYRPLSKNTRSGRSLLFYSGTTMTWKNKLALYIFHFANGWIVLVSPSYSRITYRKRVSGSQSLRQVPCAFKERICLLCIS